MFFEMDLTFSTVLDFCSDPAFSRAAHSWPSPARLGSLQGLAAAPAQTAALSPFQKSLLSAPGVDATDDEWLLYYGPTKEC